MDATLSSPAPVDQRAVEEELVRGSLPLVHHVVAEMAGRLPQHVSRDDLVSAGMLGLAQAARSFNPSLGVAFDRHAANRIRGAVLDELRSIDWVPRSVRAKAREIEKANAKLEHELHRAPTDEEMADALKITVEEFQESLVRISNSSVVALDELWTVSDASGDQVSLLDTIQDPAAVDPAREIDTTEMKDRLADAIARLPEREKLVVALYYYENLTLREIGEVLGVTESRVSQLHTKAVLRLKSRLQGDPLAEPD
jgi:RNA polymerase sigma factor for flagellar operon FliA